MFGRRWCELTVGDVGAVSPTCEFAVSDAIELVQARRGVEPLRLVVLPQRRPTSLHGLDVGGWSATTLEAMVVLI